MPTIVNREQYFERALDVVAEDGFTSVNIGRMCTPLGVTTGSFYHYFGSWKGFVAALFEYWERGQERMLADLAFGSSGPDHDIAALRTLTLALPHRAEAAIRAWGMNEPTVREAQGRVDLARRTTIGQVIARLVDDEEAARRLTSLGMALLVGYQQLAGDPEQAGLPTLLDLYLDQVRSLMAVEAAGG